MRILNKLSFLVLFLIVVTSCNKNKSIETKPVNKPIEEFVYASGDIKWNNQYDVIAETEGILTYLTISEGSKVNSNQIIGEINNKANVYNKASSNQQLAIANENVSVNSPQLNQLKENIKIAEIKYNQDKTNSERYQRLFEKESISKIELENIILNTKNSFSQLLALKEQYNQIKSQAKLQQIISNNSVENSKIQVNNNTLKASTKGKVLKLFKVKGDYVRRGEIIAHIGDDEDLKIELNVDETNITKIKLDQAVYIKLNTNKDLVYEGVISKIQPLFNIETQTYTCEVKLKKSIDFNLNGTQLEANILTNKKNKALLIPSDFLIYGNKVVLKSNDTLVVKTGIKSTDYVEVLSGLSTKDIILKPTH